MQLLFRFVHSVRVQFCLHSYKTHNFNPLKYSDYIYISQALQENLMSVSWLVFFSLYLRPLRLLCPKL
jgi:hypothetical protein